MEEPDNLSRAICRARHYPAMSRVRYRGMPSKIWSPLGRITQSGLNFVIIAIAGLICDVSSSVPA
jgi:hypothetical protein